MSYTIIANKTKQSQYKYESIQTQSIIISIFHIFTMGVSELKCERVSVKLTNNNPLTLQFSFILYELL